MSVILNEDSTLEEWCKELAEIYGNNVSVSVYPLFRWSQFMNDVTILAEETRRKRYPESIPQIARILGRFLDFIGAYLNRSPIPTFPNTDNDRWKVWQSLADLLAASFQLKSFEHLPAEHLPEGLTRWILAKYPKVCSKCGMKPCHCVVEPWVFENRREDLEAYKEYKKYIKNKEEANYKLQNELKKMEPDNNLSLKKFFTFFSGIYRNSYHKAEIDSIVMHLSEEVGEATTELTRLQLIWLAPVKIFTKKRIEEIKNVVEAKTVPKLHKIPELENEIKKRLSVLHKELDNLVSNKEETKNKMRDLFGEKFPINKGKPDEWVRLWFIVKISEKLKEELADIASWIAAIACKLDEIVKINKNHDGSEVGSEVIKELKSIYVSTNTLRPKPRCRACNQPQCNDKCLLEHSCSNELVEHIMMM